MNGASSSHNSTSRLVATSVDHPRLTATDASSIRVFLRSYDSYVTEVQERARQIVDSSVSTEPVKPVNLKFCVDAEWLESTVALGFIEPIDTVEQLTDERFRAYLDSKAEESKEVVSLSKLDELVSQELRTDMRDANATSRIQNLFINYMTLLRRHGLSWIIKENQKVAVGHVLSAIRPTSLQSRLDSDLQFSHHDLRKNFQGFLKHATRLSEAFQLLDNGKPSSQSSPSSKPHKQGRSGNRQKEHENKKTQTKSTRSLPICLYGPHKERGLRHLLRDCRECPEEEKEKLFKAYADEKAKTGPSRSTRGQRQKSAEADSDKKQSVRRLDNSSQPNAVNEPNDTSFPVTITNGTACLTANGRTDDGSDESVVSSTFAESAVLQGIGTMTNIDKVSLQVALKDSSKAQSFSFSRTWTPPRIIFQLFTGTLALVNVTFLVADDELASEDLLIGLPILRHLGIDSKTLLEQKRDLLDGIDCSSVRQYQCATHGGKISRLMLARINRVSNDEIEQQKDDFDKPATNVNYFITRNEPDPFPDSSLLDPIDSDQHDEVANAVEKMVQKSVDNGFPMEKLSTLTRLVNDHIDIFRVSFSSGPPAKFPPLKIDLQPDAKPVRVRLRNYSQAQRDFLSKCVANLVKHNMAYSNPSSPWACAPLLVPKTGPEGFRFTVDLRPVNKFTVRYQYPMPNIEHELTKTSRSSVYAEFDFVHSYWQLMLHKLSQSLQSFLTPDGIYSPTRVLHGSTNAVMYLQSSLSSTIPQSLLQNMLLWLDDILAHATNVEDLLNAISGFFAYCKEYNLKLHPAKCVLFTRQIRWCGRIISAKGVTFDPRHIDGIQNMDEPSNGAELQQFICAMQWMRNAIPTFSTIIQPLTDFMESIYASAGSRKKSAVSRVLLFKSGWSSKESDAFRLAKSALEHQVTLAHRNVDCRLCVYTDASDFLWSGMVTQIPFEDIKKPHADQRHQPLCFLSGQFKGASFGWSTLEKEASAIMSTVERMHWLLATPDGFDLFTDHHNLIFIFDPYAVVSDLSQSSMRKVLRWAVRLSAYDYTCVHISGVDNVWADILSRWCTAKVVRRLVQVPGLPSSSCEDFQWPSLEEIADEQNKHASTRPKNLHSVDNVWRNPSKAIWIPDDSTDIQLRLCIIAHTGPSGHRGVRPSLTLLRQQFFWSTMAEDVKTFIASCIHCLSTVGGEKIPRPFGPAVHGTKPNDLVQFDYIEIADAANGDKYILMVRDDHPDYKWLFPFPTTNAFNAASALVEWCAAFGVPNGFMSDGPTHFRNETLRLLCKSLRVKRHFTLPYTPWSNVAVERLGKELLRVFRAVTSELQMRPEEWPDLLPVVQSTLNQTPSPQRGNYAPVTAFTGAQPTPPIATFIRTTTTKPMSISDIQKDRTLNIDSLKTFIADLHPIVQSAVSTNRSRGREAAGRGQLPNFTEGDYVLVARDDLTAGEKLSLRWRGPRRIIKAINDYVYQVEDLRNGELQDVHITRLKFYHDKYLNTEAIMSHVVTSETGMVVQRLMRLVEDDGKLKVLVRWRGLPESEDTLEPLRQVYDDVPTLFRKLLERRNTPVHLASQAKTELGIASQS